MAKEKEVTDLTIEPEMGRGYAHMTDEEVGKDLERRFGKGVLGLGKPKGGDKK